MSLADDVVAAAGGALYWLLGGERDCFPRGNGTSSGKPYKEDVTDKEDVTGQDVSTPAAPPQRVAARTSPTATQPASPIGVGRPVYQPYQPNTRGELPPPRPTTMPGAALTLFGGQQGTGSQLLARATVAGFRNSREAAPLVVAGFQSFFYEIIHAFSGGGRQTSVGNDPTHGLTRQMAAITRENPVITALNPEGQTIGNGLAATLGTVTLAAAPDSSPANDSRFRQQASVSYNLGVGTS